MKAILSVVAAATTLLHPAEAMKEIKPGVFSIPAKKRYTKERHPHLEHGSPLVGDWAEAEMWNYEVKEPVYNLDNYLYAVDCEIGDAGAVPSGVSYTNSFKCIFDTNTSHSSALSSSMNTYGNTFYEPTYSTTKED